MDSLFAANNYDKIYYVRYKGNGYMITINHFGSKSQNEQKPKKVKKKDKESDTSNKKQSESPFEYIQGIWKWALGAAQEMAKNAETTSNVSKKKKNDENEKWIEMYKEIKKENDFVIDINPSSFKECNKYLQLSRSEFMHKTMMKINYYPLKYEEFMVGAFQGIQFILQCLEENDIDSIKDLVDKELFKKFVDEQLRDNMIDEEYCIVGKIMGYLETVDNGPNFNDTSINAQYLVTYYYQLLKRDDEQDFIQKRINVIWQSSWEPVKGTWTFAISQDGWKLQDVTECVDIDKAPKAD